MTATTGAELTPTLVASLRVLVERLGPLQRGCFCDRTQMCYGDPARRCMQCLLENAERLIAQYEGGAK